MSLIDKQNELLQKLHDTDYQCFDGDKEEAFDFVRGALEAFPDYANVVIKEQVMIPIWQRTCEGDEFRDNMQSIDRRRHDAHENAICSMDMLNRTNERLGLKPFFDIDTSDRYAVADTVGQYVCEMYNEGNGKTLDDAVLGKTQEYDTKKISERLKSAVNELETTGCILESNHEFN